MGNQAAAGLSSRQMLRHTVATLAYRANKALSGVPAEFATFKAGERSRTPVQIVAHMGDLFDWAVHLAHGEHVWHKVPVLDWEAGVQRFFDGLQAFDDVLAADGPLGFPEEKVFQGPIADALTHTGQISILRGMAGCPVRAENYFKADIAAGRVGQAQSAPHLEF